MNDIRLSGTMGVDAMGTSPELRAGPQTTSQRFREALMALAVPTFEVNGEDMSVYQGTVNYELNSSKVDFTDCRLSYGNNGVDLSAENHIAGAAGHGDPAGGYHYVKPAYDWRKNAANFASRFNALAGGLNLGAWADLEESGGLKKSELESWLYKFWNEVEQKIGKVVGCYTSAGFLNTALPLTSWLKTKPLWVASWTNGATPLIPQEWAVAGRTYKKWQWKVYKPGSDYGVQSAGIDLDRYNGTRAQFNAEYGVVPAEPPTPPPPVPGDGGLQLKVLVSALNVRSGPGTNYPVVGSLAEGDVVSPLNVGGQNAWVEVEPGRWAAVQVGEARFMGPV